MNLSPDTRAAFRQAEQHRTEGRLLEAEQIYKSLTKMGESRCLALEALSELYIKQQRWDECVKTLRLLTDDDPENFQFVARLAQLLDSIGNTQLAVDAYARLLERRPDLAVAHFNVAQLYKKLKQNDAVVAAYEDAIRLGIDHVEEVYLNLGAFYSEKRNGDKAREMYEKALSKAPDYIAALYNLAGLHEEMGKKQAALDLYSRILDLQPDYWDALARLAYTQKMGAGNKELLESLEKATLDASGNALAHETLNFALGKAYDDLKQYDKALEAYSAANALGKRRVLPYERGASERAFDQLIALYDPAWLREMATDSEAQPIFICGMFRSGSTLLEQMLGAHPSIVSGGELDVLPWLIGRNLAPFPTGLKNASAERLRAIADFYQSHVNEMFPGAGYVTDKRPDNFVHLGLARVLFPKAKIIHTMRDIRDNALSIFFQQFGNKLGYAINLSDIAHYRAQQDRLKAHWTSCFGDDIFTVRYEELVEEPESVLRPLLSHLELDWDDRVLKPSGTDGVVKTASIWQVRQSAHNRSIGRWRNYEPLINAVAELASVDPA